MIDLEIKDLNRLETWKKATKDLLNSIDNDIINIDIYSNKKTENIEVKIGAKETFNIK